MAPQHQQTNLPVHMPFICTCQRLARRSGKKNRTIRLIHMAGDGTTCLANKTGSSRRARMANACQHSPISQGAWGPPPFSAHRLFRCRLPGLMRLGGGGGFTAFPSLHMYHLLTTSDERQLERQLSLNSHLEVAKVPPRKDHEDRHLQKSPG